LKNLVEIKSKELMQKENILNHQSKMAAMGEMLENIAHQWRQPLSLISTVATGAKLKKELEILTDDEFYETMETINNSSQHLIKHY
jgi:signal transduction histidine kinase